MAGKLNNQDNALLNSNQRLLTNRGGKQHAKRENDSLHNYLIRATGFIVDSHQRGSVRLRCDKHWLGRWSAVRRPALYGSKCAICHGKGGTGTRPGKLKVNPIFPIPTGRRRRPTNKLPPGSEMGKEKCRVLVRSFQKRRSRLWSSRFAHSDISSEAGSGVG